LLLLDEPTNHLDIPSQEILQDILAEYQGTILLVSHDRYLIDALATQVWEIDESAGSLTVFKGSYSEYRTFQEAAREAERQSIEAQKREGSPNTSHAQASPVGPARTRSSNEERRRLVRLQEVENAITALEGRLAALSLKLENPPSDPMKVQKLGNEYVQVQKELDHLLLDWERLHSEG
jgi:ATP-binding cassette subfamily F protein 3